MSVKDWHVGQFVVVLIAHAGLSWLCCSMAVYRKDGALSRVVLTGRNDETLT